MFRPARFLVPMLFALASLSAGAADVVPAPAPTTMDLQAEASRPAPNDLVMASAYFEATEARPAELARRVNAVVAQALKTAAAYPSVKTRSGGTYTYPVYAPKGGRIDAWRMRSELLFEAQDLPALSELLGKLQDNLAISGISFMPAPATRAKAADQAAVDAIAAFRERAGLLAAALGKHYRIRHLEVSSGNAVVLRRSAMLKAEMAAPAAMPAEAGESNITIRVGGTIELTD